MFTFTGYTGYDPEVGFAYSGVGSAAIDRWDTPNLYPNYRTITASLEVVF
jgi:hypothetical protein